MKKNGCLNVIMAGFVVLFLLHGTAYGLSDVFKENIYVSEGLAPTDSVLTVAVGEKAPNFTLPSVYRGKISLSQYFDKKNVVISFVPAAWTPVCSDQWPGYNIVKDLFDENDAVLLGITADNIPTLFAWTNQMGKLWFPVLSDFWPHGGTASKYGVLRSDGTAERAIFIIDKKGIIRYIDVHERTGKAEQIELIIPIKIG
ncbi:MAG: redoxin domain-containing protein [Thermodesulfobacteriota bacterium]|nr:redoxin domain-containing protein [Thermodesulfobacteriota bacterium]